jgi:hypothetical protein
VSVEARLASLETRVAALEGAAHPGRRRFPVIVSEEGVCGVDPDSDPTTCPHASLYRRRKGCLGEGCMAKASAYYEGYRGRVAQESIDK